MKRRRYDFTYEKLHGKNPETEMDTIKEFYAKEFAWLKANNIEYQPYDMYEKFAFRFTNKMPFSLN